MRNLLFVKEIESMKQCGVWVVVFVLASTFMHSAAAGASEPHASSIKGLVDPAVRAEMKRFAIPGMAVGVSVNGHAYVFDYGVASLDTAKPVDRTTLFEIGSISKTFVATVTSYAALTGRLSLSDDVARFVPPLRGTPFGGVSLLSLGTHTPGGLPLQVPSGVESEAQLLAYLERWHPAYAQGTRRTYSNIGVGMLGSIAATSLHRDYAALMQDRFFPALGMRDSYIRVPPSRLTDYAQGYTSGGAPARMTTGVLGSEAYGIRTTAADMIRFLQANMSEIRIDPTLQRALIATHTGYFQAGVMTQDLLWEQLPYPVSLAALLQANSSSMLYDATPVTRITPPESPRNDVWINKTGSTRGFGAYAAFIPVRRIGIVILANKSYPIPERVKLAYRIVTDVERARFARRA